MHTTMPKVLAIETTHAYNTAYVDAYIRASMENIDVIIQAYGMVYIDGYKDGHFMGHMHMYACSMSPQYGLYQRKYIPIAWSI